MLVEALLTLSLALPIVDLKLEAQPTAQYGEVIDVHILGRGSSDAQPATFTFAGVILEWDPEILEPVELTKCNSDYAWFMVYFCSDLQQDPCFCINGRPPWPSNDGLAFVSHVAQVPYGVRYINNEWHIFSTVKFAVLKQETTSVRIRPRYNACKVKTAVTRHVMHDVTGDLGEPAEILIENPCSADINGDGIVNVQDFLRLIAEWGGPGPPPVLPPAP
jgi:hypothetical protein